MTDLTPNDLSHMSDEDFSALCPQGEHAPGPEPLSPAAQAVLDAAGMPPFMKPDGSLNFEGAIAAALRAAADQVVPESGKFLSPGTAGQIRAGFLAIAAELDLATGTSGGD